MGFFFVFVFSPSKLAKNPEGKSEIKIILRLTGKKVECAPGDIGKDKKHPNPGFFREFSSARPECRRLPEGLDYFKNQFVLKNSDFLFLLKSHKSRQRQKRLLVGEWVDGGT